MEDTLRNNHIKKQTILSRPGVQLVRDIRIGRQVRRQVELGPREETHQKARCDFLFPDGQRLRTNSTSRAILNMRPVGLWPDWSSKAQIADWRRGIADVAEVIHSMSTLLTLLAGNSLLSIKQQTHVQCICLVQLISQVHYRQRCPANGYQGQE